MEALSTAATYKSAMQKGGTEILVECFMFSLDI